MEQKHFRFAFVGDVCLPFLKNTPAHLPDFKSWPAIKREIGKHDFLVGNLECCLVDERCGQDALKQSMATPISAGTFLHDIGFSDLCLANNHSMDCGTEALEVTRECLASRDIRGFGAGTNIHEAEEPVFAERNGCKIAFIGACDKSELYASERRVGVAPLERARLGARVRAAAAQADLVVTMLHADLEFSDVPGRWRQRMSRWLVDQGAHLVIQHHPHVLQGIEEYHGGLIAYSLGNFIFQLEGNQYQEHHAGVFDSMVLVVDVDMADDGPLLEHRIIPVRIGNDHFPHQVPEVSRGKVSARLQVLSSLVAERGVHRRIWFRRCRLEALGRIRHIYYALRRGDIANVLRTLHQLLTCREDRRWMQGLASLGYL